MINLLAAFLVCVLPSSSRAQMNIEALKAGGLKAPALAPEVPAPAGARAQSTSYETGEYASRQAAQQALDDAQLSLRRAGLAVLGARLVPSADKKTYAIHVDYADPQENQDHPARTVDSYQSGEFNSSSQASLEMENSLANLRRAGYVPVRAQVARAEGKFKFQVDYIAGAQNPERQSILYTSGYYYYAYRAVAANDMMTSMAVLQARGAVILAYALFPVRGTPYWVYQIRYLAP